MEFDQNYETTEINFTYYDDDEWLSRDIYIHNTNYISLSHPLMNGMKVPKIEPAISHKTDQLGYYNYKDYEVERWSICVFDTYQILDRTIQEISDRKEQIQ